MIRQIQYIKFWLIRMKFNDPSSPHEQYPQVFPVYPTPSWVKEQRLPWFIALNIWLLTLRSEDLKLGTRLLLQTAASNWIRALHLPTVHIFPRRRCKTLWNLYTPIFPCVCWLITISVLWNSQGLWMTNMCSLFWLLIYTHLCRFIIWSDISRTSWISINYS